MVIRRLTPSDDIDHVSRVYARSWKAAYQGLVPQEYLDSLPENRWSPFLAEDPSQLWLACEGEEIIGASTYGPARDGAMPGWGEIVSIYLLPEFYRRGIGSKLFEASLESLVSMGYSDVYLWVLEDNHPARRFYEKNGFQCNGDALCDTIGGKELREIRYILHLGK